MNDNILLARTKKSERPRICKMFLLHQQKGKREREREGERERERDCNAEGNLLYSLQKSVYFTVTLCVHPRGWKICLARNSSHVLYMQAKRNKVNQKGTFKVLIFSL